MPLIEQNESSYILNLQRYLRRLSGLEQDIPAPPLDGVFDTATENALRAYQVSRALPATGRADQVSWERLYADYLAAEGILAPVERLRIFPEGPVGYAVYPDEEHFLITVIQYLLNELRLVYDDIPENSQSGRYDDPTRRGVFAVQRRHDLPQQDMVDRATWNALVGAHNRLFDGSEL